MRTTVLLIFLSLGTLAGLKAQEKSSSTKNPHESKVKYIICEQGMFPSRSGGASVDEAMLGEVRRFAGNFAPSGWAFCDGQIRLISENMSLFSILGTTYGGIIPSLRIDYILLDPRIETIDHRIFRKPYSDHYPVLTQFDIK